MSAGRTSDLSGLGQPDRSGSQRPPRLTLYLFGLTTVILWGASFPVTKAALAYTGPTSLAFLRWTVSAVFLAGWLAVAGRREPASSLAAAGRMLRGQWKTAAWVALTGISLFYFLENYSLRYTTATNAGVLSNLVSVFMVLLGGLVLHERLGWLEWGALLVAFAGSALVSQGAGHLTLGGTGLLGDAMMVVASFFGAVFSIGGKQLTRTHSPIVVTTVTGALGALFLLPLALLEGLRFDLPPSGWAMIGLLGIGSGALANLFWLRLLRHTAASRAALLLFLIPIVSAALSVALLHEPVTPLLVIGSALVLSGVLAVQSRPA